MYSPLVWAYIGDAVYELRVRERLIEKSYAKPHTLHLRSIKLVNAKKQARILEGLEETLTEEEKTIARRARNTKNFHVPKGTSVAEYAKSTALEAVIGYHHINGNEKRRDGSYHQGISWPWLLGLYYNGLRFAEKLRV
mgnify:CR=1 FL=1